MFRKLISKLTTIPQEGGQETSAIINPEITNPGILKVGVVNIDLNTADTRLLDACDITFENGILSINTNDDVELAQIPSKIAGVKLKGLNIKTAGKINLTGTNKLVLEHGLILDSNEVNLDALISPGTGIVKIVAKQPVELRNIIAASGVIVDAPEITNAAIVATNRLAMIGNKLTQKGQLITNTKEMPFNCIKDLVNNKSTDKLFIDAFNQLDDQVKECKENVRKPINERTAAEVVKSGFFEIVKDIKTRKEPRSRIKIAEVVIEKGCEIAGAKLEIEAEKSLKIYGKIKVDDLTLDSNYIYAAFSGAVDGISKLTLRGRKLFTLTQITAADINVRMHYVLALFSGSIWASEKIMINSLITSFALGGRVWARDIIINTGFYINFLGWGAAYNYIVDTFVPLDMGLTTPYMITSFRDLKNSINFAKFIGSLKTAVNFIYKPFGMLLKAILKVGTILRSLDKLNKIYQEYEVKRAAKEAAARERGEVVIIPTTSFAYAKSVAYDMHAHMMELSDNPIDAMNIALAFKNIAYAANAVADVQNVIEQVEKTPLNVPTDLASAQAAVQDNAAGFALCWSPMFLPCYVMDSWRGKRMGCTITGYQVLTHTKLDDEGHRSKLLLG